MRLRLASILGLLLAACGTANAPATAPATASASAPVSAPVSAPASASASVSAPVSVPVSVAAFEVVESFPSGTTLDHADIPNAPDVWLSMIRGAKRTLDIEHFYISNAPGSKLDAVLVAIEEAAARGVRVRVLLDAKFYKKYPESADRLAARAGILVRKLDLSARDAVQHAKFFVVDGSDLYVGSQNMDYRALEHIQEIGARVHLPEVTTAMSGIFEMDWATAGGEPAPMQPAGSAVLSAHFSLGGEDVTVMPTASPNDLLPSGVSWDLTKLVTALDNAKTSIDVQVLTYRTKSRNGKVWSTLDDALRSAAGRGVRVRLLVADWSKRAPTIDSLKELAKTPGIKIRFIVIPQSSSGFIPFARVAHAKYMVVDGAVSWIGTSNWEGDYFTASRNVGLVVDSKSIAAKLERVFEDGYGGAYAEALDSERVYEAPRVE